MDSSLPELDGVLATREIIASCPGTAVLMCSMHSEDTWVRRAIETGAHGYVSKNALDCDLSSVILRAASRRLFCTFPSRMNKSLSGSTD
jgi:two-component system response regulator NreC